MDWLQEQLGDGDDDYFLFDCPGQIELYTHIPVMRQIIDCLTQWDFRLCGVFLVDSQFLIDVAKLFSGAMTATAAMVQLEIPHINVMSKMDLLSRRDRQRVESYLELDTVSLVDELGGSMGAKYANLNRAVASILDDYSLVRFIPLNSTSEESISDLLLQIDAAMQYGEDQEVRNVDVNTYDDDDDDTADDG
jgi:GTPase SAR1 family protein